VKLTFKGSETTGWQIIGASALGFVVTFLWLWLTFKVGQ
jgi:hypothetical protein